MSWRSALKRLVRAAILLEVLYLVVANLLLWLPAFRRHLDAARPGFSLRFERAWTPLPGLVFVRHLDLARDGRVRQWSFHADRGWGFFDPFRLASRTIRFSHIAAEGLEIRVRARPLPNRAPEPERERLLPPLPGMSWSLPSTAALPHRRAWRFRVDDLSARDVREVWIDAVRFEGKATGEGGFTSRPRESLQIFPSEIRVASGSLLIGDRLLASELVAELTGRGDELALPVRFASSAWLAPLTVTGSLRAQGVDAQALAPLLPTGGALRFTGGSGPIDARWVLEAGVLGPGTEIDWRPQLLVADGLGYRAEGTARLSVGVATADAPLRLDLAFDHYRLTRLGAASAHVEGTDLTASLESRDRRLDDKLEGGIRAEVRLREGRVADLRAYNAYLPERLGLAVSSGSGLVSAHFLVSEDGRGKGEIALATTGAKLHWDSLTLAGRLALSAPLATHDVAQGRYSLAGTSVHLDEVTVRRGQQPEHRDGWWARIDLPAGELAPGQETYLTATLVAKLRDGAPLEALFSERRPLLGRLVAGLDTQGLGARGRVRVRKGGLDFDEIAVQYPHGSLAADLRFAGRQRSGRLLVRWRRLALGLEFRGQERNWILKNAEAWWQGRGRQSPP
ncbi:MAG: hypothetical protein SF066_23800 [Thermoanaerobaculia bacterium]|nr:hypothetical protein [Thermoanaerobaculia bacterium]